MCPQLPKTSEGGRVGPPRSTVGILPNLLPSTRHTTSKDQTCAARPRLPKQERPLPPCCHLPLPLTPSIPYPTPMPTHSRPATPHLPPLRHPTSPTDAVFLSGGCFIHPHRGPCSLSGGCSPVVSSGIRVISAPRGSNPPSRNNPQAGLPRRRPHKNTIPSCPPSRSGTTANQPQSCFGTPPRDPRHGTAGKTRELNSMQCNSPNRPCRRKV